MSFTLSFSCANLGKTSHIPKISGFSFAKNASNSATLFDKLSIFVKPIINEFTYELFVPTFTFVLSVLMLESDVSVTNDKILSVLSVKNDKSEGNKEQLTLEL